MVIGRCSILVRVRQWSEVVVGSGMARSLNEVLAAHANKMSLVLVSIAARNGCTSAQQNSWKTS